MNHLALLETMFATARLGAIFVPLNFRLTGPELAFIVEEPVATRSLQTASTPTSSTRFEKGAMLTHGKFWWNKAPQLRPEPRAGGRAQVRRHDHRRCAGDGLTETAPMVTLLTSELAMERDRLGPIDEIQRNASGKVLMRELRDTFG